MTLVYVAAGVIVLLALVLLIMFLAAIFADVSTGELRQVQAERDRAADALDRIDHAADCIRDLDDPNALLASEVRQIVREYRNERPKIT